MKKNFSLNMVRVIFLLPITIFLLYSTIIPFLWNFILSFQKWDGMGKIQWVNFANYTKAFADKLVFKSLLNSIIFAVGTTIGATILGLFLATLLYKIKDRSGSAFRLILFFPAMLPIAVVGLMFTFLYNAEMGLINNFFRLLGLESWTHIWLQETNTALLSVIIAAVWQVTGSVMMLCFAAMQNVPISIFESAKIEGAGYFKTMWLITYPLIKPMILLAVINTLGTQFKTYNIFSVMTQGGPGYLTYTVPIYMTKLAFTYGKFGYSASIGVIFTLVVILFLFLAKKIVKGDSYEY